MKQHSELAVLEVRNLQTSFFTENGEVRAVDGVTFTVPKGKTLGIVGESGSGKSITSLSLMRLLPANGKIKEGEVMFKGQNLLELSEKKMREVRGNVISMIFQEPMTSLNPAFTVGQQISEALVFTKNYPKKKR